MRSSFILCGTAMLFGLGSAGPARRAACNADSCARAITGTSLGTASRSARLADCSSFLSYTVDPAIPTVTSTVTPSASTTTVYVATVTKFQTSITETDYPTTINSEIYTQNNNRRVAAASASTCSVASTITPTALPSYASSACSASARYSSACSCAGVTPRYTSYGCYTVYSTVTAPARTTVTKRATYTENDLVFATQTATTALVDDIRCGQIIQIDEDLPAYKIVCEAQGVGNRTLLETLDHTDWDNCVERATWGLGADDWEFDLIKNTCYIYDKFPSNPGRNVTTPRSHYVYAYIYE